jgi:predicted flap endonuclease-1-like 5' DNA nuclease
MWKYFLLGLLAGWLLAWIVDWIWWRRSPRVIAPARASAQGEAGDATTAGTSAGTVAGRIAVGAPGAVSTSSATLYSVAPVYRQEDLEAIDGIGPKVGAMLRNNGITTFAQLAATPVAELVRIVQSTGEDPGLAGLETWPARARLAAARDWSGFAATAAAGVRSGPGAATTPEA